MRSTTTRSLVLGSVLAGALTLGATHLAAGDDGTAAEETIMNSRSAQAAPDADQRRSTTAREHGIVLEGTGTWRGQPVQVFVYENQKHGNSLQIVIGDPDGQHAIGTGEGRDAYVIDGVLNVGLEVDGDLAVIKGSVTVSGDPVRVEESAPDGELITATGTRTRLSVQASFEYRGETVDLDFGKAFGFDLESSRGSS